jgi:hypothetical protein
VPLEDPTIESETETEEKPAAEDFPPLKEPEVYPESVPWSGKDPPYVPEESILTDSDWDGGVPLEEPPLSEPPQARVGCPLRTGLLVGRWVVEALEGAKLGRGDGALLGQGEGFKLGRTEGATLGDFSWWGLGRAEGATLGRADGAVLGREDGASLGRTEGATLGRVEG